MAEVADLEAEILRLKKDRRTAMKLLAMIIIDNGGELRVTPLLIGDEEILRWRDPVTYEYVLGLK